MNLRPAKVSELEPIRSFVNEINEHVAFEVHTLDYYKRLHKDGIIIVAESTGIVGVCFGTYSVTEHWAELVLVAVKKSHRKRGTGSMLVLAFEQVAKEKGIKNMHYFANKHQIAMMRGLGFKAGNMHISFRKEYST